ncbi:STAS domain-containing protein [Peribacillus glennii]|uniref:STAS domain-containing protein n=1 Tax=Peribacillus glennii TaxID=2303991 RepID=A0A372LCM0_9BACI|nr:STAS domain-containing protein [Peribacillus glennii]RFU62834.1 STAS domain-containing protein [Peribacillus glennii]
MSSLESVSKYLINNAASLAAEIIDYNITKLDFTVPDEVVNKAINVHTEFIKLLAEAVTNADTSIVTEGLIEWSKQNGEREASLMGKISSLIKPYADTRLFFINQITKISIDHGLSTEEVVMINSRVNYMLDISMTETILAYEEYTDNIIKKRSTEANELSAPVVPIQDGMAVLPLIGSFDYDRTEHLLNKVVPKISELRVECLIIDFSGIVTIDMEVANHIFNVNKVLRLLGINVIATGIRPDLATKAIGGGIDFSSIRTYANVKQAIESIG